MVTGKIGSISEVVISPTEEREKVRPEPRQVGKGVINFSSLA